MCQKWLWKRTTHETPTIYPQFLNKYTKYTTQIHATYNFWKRPSLLCFSVWLTSWGLDRATMAPSNSVPFPVLMVVGLKASHNGTQHSKLLPVKIRIFLTFDVNILEDTLGLCWPLIQKYTKIPKTTDYGTTSLTSSLARAQNQFYEQGWYLNKNEMLHFLILLLCYCI